MPAPIHLLRQIIDSIAEPIRARLVAAGAAPDVALAPPTREAAGDLALPCHKYARVFRKAPQLIAIDLAEAVAGHPLVEEASPVAGFLNLRFAWGEVARRVVDWAQNDDGARGRSDTLAGQKVVIEFSSPNTNKPQHLGHCRNNVLGATTANLLAAAGADVERVNLVNDRGIHICKSMVAYRRMGGGQTPDSTAQKGDHFVGDYYVRFDQAFRAEYAAAFPDGDGDKDAYFNAGSEIGAEAREMLQAWEAGDAEVRHLWRQMNDWCMAGFDATYRRMGVEFDRVYVESETYLLGKSLIDAGLEAGHFGRRDDGATIFDLDKIGLEGDKVVLRSDGTSVYTTQDLGTAVARYDDYHFDKMIYVVGNEQDHHFRVLFGILGEIRPELRGRLVHMSYGMVELPDGKMKSREGTVVDADDLMDTLRDEAAAIGRELWPQLDDADARQRAEAIGLGGLKFFLLKFAPETNFTFDPAKSVEVRGETGAYCQYAYARASSILRKLPADAFDVAPDFNALVLPQERALMTAMLRFPDEVRGAAVETRPSLLARGTFDLAKAFAAFFNEPMARVLDAEPTIRAARAGLVRGVRRMLGAGLELMGIVAPEEM